jgi:hypothetical protein
MASGSPMTGGSPSCSTKVTISSMAQGKRFGLAVTLAKSFMWCVQSLALESQAFPGH